MKRALFGIVLAALAVEILSAQSGRSALPSCDPDNGGLKLPAGFCALVVAENPGIVRHMVVAPNGDLFVWLHDENRQTRDQREEVWRRRGAARFERRRPL